MRVLFRQLLFAMLAFGDVDGIRIFFLLVLKGQYHAIYSNTLKIGKTLFG